MQNWIKRQDFSWALRMWQQKWDILGSNAVGGLVFGLLIATIVWLVQL